MCSTWFFSIRLEALLSWYRGSRFCRGPQEPSCLLRLDAQLRVLETFLLVGRSRWRAVPAPCRRLPGAAAHLARPHPPLTPVFWFTPKSQGT